MKPFPPKRLARIARGEERIGRSTFKIDVAEIRAKQTAMSKEVADALFGKRKQVDPERAERKRAKDAADKWFSEFIRLRDAGPDGRVKCITCSHTDHWRYLQCGHYVTRGHAATRFNPKNCSAQCAGCNYNGGQHLKHAEAIDVKFGSGTADALELQGKKTCKRTTKNLWDIAIQFKEAVAEIKRTQTAKYDSPTLSNGNHQ